MDSDVRSAACTALGQIGDIAAVPELITRLDDANCDVRCAACTALGLIGDASAVPALIARLGGRYMSKAAANALVQIGKPAVPALIEALTSPSNRVRIAACTALGQIGDNTAVPKLIECLKDIESIVRSTACTALGLIGDTAAIPALRVHAEIMEEAQQALAKLGGTSMALQEAVRSLAEQSQWGVLCRALTSNKVRAAIMQLGSSAVPALIDALRDDDTEIRQAACTALGQIRDKAPVPSLIEHLKDTNRDVRKAACTALGQIRDSSAVPALISLLCDEEVDVRITATDALVNIGEAAIPALQEAITSGDPTIHKKVSGILYIIKQRMQR
jgi:HEAT repeat protein